MGLPQHLQYKQQQGNRKGNNIMIKPATFSKTAALQQQLKTGWPSLVAAVLLPFLAAAIGGLAMQRSGGGWYQTLRKPAWNPPAWLFGPAWTVLYLLMGVASWLVWQKGTKAGHERNEPLASRIEQQKQSTAIRQALAWYGLQLVANLLWPLLFFGARRIRFALGELIVLWTLIAGTALQFYRIRPLAGELLLPYFAWTSFAAVLNATIWRLNRNRAEGV